MDIFTVLFYIEVPLKIIALLTSLIVILTYYAAKQANEYLFFR